jgi:hypothetical protein
LRRAHAEKTGEFLLPQAKAVDLVAKRLLNTYGSDTAPPSQNVRCRNLDTITTEEITLRMLWEDYDNRRD